MKGTLQPPQVTRSLATGHDAGLRRWPGAPHNQRRGAHMHQSHPAQVLRAALVNSWSGGNNNHRSHSLMRPQDHPAGLTQKGNRRLCNPADTPGAVTELVDTTIITACARSATQNNRDSRVFRARRRVSQWHDSLFRNSNKSRYVSWSDDITPQLQVSAPLFAFCFPLPLPRRCR